jgi:hypothetical protein
VKRITQNHSAIFHCVSRALSFTNLAVEACYIIQLNSAGRRAIRQLDSFLLVLGLLIPWEAVICIWNGLEKYSLLRDIFALGMGQSS